MKFEKIAAERDSHFDIAEIARAWPGLQHDDDGSHYDVSSRWRRHGKQDDGGGWGEIQSESGDVVICNEESDFSTLPLRICCIICFCIYVFINRNCRFSINLFNSSWHEAVTPFKNFLFNSIVYRYHLFQNISKKHSVLIKFNFSYTTLT